MSNPFGHFWLFVGAVGVHAVTLAAGCIVTVVINLLEKYVFKKTLPWQADVSILLAFVFFACFQAWRDEYEKASNVSSSPSVQITNEVKVPPTTIPAPIVNFPPQMAYMASDDIGLVTPTLGDHVWVSNRYRNISQSVPAERVTRPMEVEVVDTKLNAVNQPIVAVSVQDRAYEHFQRSIAKNEQSTQTFGPGESKFGSTFTQSILDQTLDAAFTAGTKTILFTAEYDWQDGLGRHRNQVCAWLQMVPGIPIGKAPITWNYCLHHNGLQSQ